MNVKIKQNKNTPAVRVASAALAVIVLLFSLCVPVFAYTDSWDGSISALPVLSSFPSSPFSSMALVQKTSTYLYYRSCSFGSDIYAFFVGSSGANTVLYYCSKTSNAHAGYATYHTAGQTTTSDKYCSTQSGDWYYTDVVQFNLGSSVTLYYPLYSSIQDGLDAIDASLTPLPDPQGPLNISIPCGNALFIDITDLTGLTGSLSTQTNQSYSSPYSWNSTLSYTDSVPTSGTSIGNPINWVGTGGTDVFGRYRSWNCNLIVQPNKKYIAITNPFFNSEYLDPEHEDTNFPITVSLSNYRDYFFVPLNAEYVNGQGVQNNYTDEQTQNPVPGGNNTSTTGNSINDFLQNIASSISGFFQGAIGAVSTLVSSGQDFIRSLSGLYAWLPGPVYAVLTSALILVITIGVIKVFI